MKPFNAGQLPRWAAIMFCPVLLIRWGESTKLKRYNKPWDSYGRSKVWSLQQQRHQASRNTNPFTGRGKWQRSYLRLMGISILFSKEICIFTLEFILWGYLLKTIICFALFKDHKHKNSLALVYWRESVGVEYEGITTFS